MRTAWICDDAAITLRHVMNFIHGFGPVFNHGERVQGFTHPLWFLLLSLATFVGQNIYWSVYVLSIGLTILSLDFLLTKISLNATRSLLVCSVLLLSKAFVDYSTSGLENSLSHFVLALGFWYGFQYIEKQDVKFAKRCLWILSLSYLCRPDLILVVIPFGLFVLFRASIPYRMKCLWLLQAVTPGILWTTFSFIYYGTPLANTYYAKLNTSIPHLDLLYQGGLYLQDSFYRDPVTLIFIVTTLFISVFQKRPELRAICLGVIFYLTYILWIGGDFMSGRFLTVPLFCCAIISVRYVLDPNMFPVYAITLLVPGLLFSRSTILSGFDYTNTEINMNGIADERGFYYQKHGLLSLHSGALLQPDWSIREQQQVFLRCDLGYFGLVKHPNAFIIDTCALTEPFLARLPAKNDQDWRIGHFTRQIPTNYVKSVAQNRNLMVDETAGKYWEAIRTITHAPVFNIERLKTMLKFNFGQIEAPSAHKYRFENVPSQIVSIHQLNQELVETGKSVDSPANLFFYSSIEVLLDKPTSIVGIDISLAEDVAYSLGIMDGELFIPFVEFDSAASSQMIRRIIRLKNPTPPIQTLVLKVTRSSQARPVGHLKINPNNI